MGKDLKGRELGKGLYQRKDGRYEARTKVNGSDVSIYGFNLRELKKELYFAVITGFGRSISEVGAVMLVGGNIKGHTRTMTTTISLLKSQGIFTEGLTLGVLLLIMAFIIQSLADFFQRGEKTDENY